MNRPDPGDGLSGTGPEVRILVREGCHLCDEAERDLRTLLAGYPAATLELVDIETDDALHRRHMERIPVVEVDGREVCVTFFEPDSIREALSGRYAGGR